MSEPWPYNLPIFRRSHKAVSPDGADCAEMSKAYEVSMSNPTYGLLKLKSGITLKNCSPSFIWSDDSRYLVVPRYFMRFGLFRRQRIAVLDIQSRYGYLSPDVGYYFQPENFEKGLLEVTKEPFHTKEKMLWKVPECLESFYPFRL